MSLEDYTIRPHSLLTAKEELALARRIRRGFREKLSGSKRSPRRQFFFSPDAAAALAELVEHNQRLVGVIAGRFGDSGIPREDVVGAGELGLMYAAVKFDPRRKFRFTTYASWWIRQTIHRALKERSLISVPVHAQERGVKPLCVQSLNYTEDGRDRGLAVGSRTPPVDLGMIEELEDVMEKLGHVCSGRDLEILLARMEGYKLVEIGAWHSISRERVRQIVKETIEKLKAELQEDK